MRLPNLKVRAQSYLLTDLFICKRSSSCATENGERIPLELSVALGSSFDSGEIAHWRCDA